MDGALLQVLNTAKADTLLIFDDALRAVRSEKDEAVECARELKEEEVETEKRVTALESEILEAQVH